jgi:SRSO17 transposase
MDLVLDADTGRRLEAYFDVIGELLGHPARRASFATYAMGLLAEGERKSVEPIAARACPDPEKVDPSATVAPAQRLQLVTGARTPSLTGA